MDLEKTVDLIAPYLYERSKELPVGSAANYRGVCFPVGELAATTGTNPRMLGKIRKSFKKALAQSMTPGREPEFEVMEQNCFGKSAIAVRRIKEAA